MRRVRVKIFFKSVNLKLHFSMGAEVEGYSKSKSIACFLSFVYCICSCVYLFNPKPLSGLSFTTFSVYKWTGSAFLIRAVGHYSIGRGTGWWVGGGGERIPVLFSMQYLKKYIHSLLHSNLLFSDPQFSGPKTRRAGAPNIVIVELLPFCPSHFLR